MPEEIDLLEDDEFIRIQKLNSVEEGTERRHSIVYDKPVPGLEHPGPITDVATVVEELEGASLSTTSSISQVSTREEQDSILKRYLSRLHNVEKRRYRKSDESAISFFADVDFDERPTLLDAVVAKPFINTFEGPVMERQMKKQNGKARASQKDMDLLLLNKKNKFSFDSDFSGIYIMMWMLFGWISIRGLVDYYVAHDGGLINMPILRAMTSNWHIIWPLDLAFWLSTFFVVFIQHLVQWNIISWNSTGRYMAVIFEILHPIVCNYIVDAVFHLNWITRIFFYLHSIVFVMKMHSFSFFNGYLWNIKRELDYSKGALSKYKEKLSPEIKETLERSLKFCEYELSTQSASVKFPDNITCKSFLMFSMFPTLVYQFEYPRTKKIRWGYVFEKLCAIFGIIFLMIMNAQLFIYPACEDALMLRGQKWPDMWTSTIEWWYLLAELIPGITIEYMLVFYLIWDAILNCVAELTRFADRYFYGDWWNCTLWSEFSRIWNVPVHKFLLRHVYHSSMNHWKFTKIQATMFTFILSSIFHELAMIIIYHKIRPYLFLFQLAQLPMTFVTSHTILKDYPVLCNILFIFGVCTGPPVITALYFIY